MTLNGFAGQGVEHADPARTATTRPTIGPASTPQQIDAFCASHWKRLHEKLGYGHGPVRLIGDRRS